MSGTVDETAARGVPLAAVGSALGLGLGGFFLGLLLLSAAVPVLPDPPAEQAVSTAVHMLGIATAAAAYLYVRGASWRYLRVSTPSLREVGWALATVAGLLATVYLITNLVEFLGLPIAEHAVADDADENPRSLLFLVPVTLVFVAPAEELLYRGVIQTRLREAFDAVPAVFVASTVFAVVHLPAYAAAGGLGPGIATSLVTVFVLGSFLGAVYEHTGNLVVAAVAHGVYNAVVFGANYYEAVAALAAGG